jgi:hypothetical protein
MWVQNLHQSTWDYEILYSDRASEDEKLLIDNFREKLKVQTWRAVEF